MFDEFTGQYNILLSIPSDFNPFKILELNTSL